MSLYAIDLILFIAAVGLTYLGVALYRSWSSTRGIVDRPNERSSHAVPTPLGGGVVIALVCLIAFTVLSFMGEGRPFWGYLAGASLVVVISWLDDLYSIPFFWRLLCHAAAAGLLIADTGYLSAVSVPGTNFTFAFGAFGAIVTAGWVIWMINAYNFMDGIDGIAGLQAVIAGVGWSILALHYSDSGIHFYALIVASASLGFLFHNWQPARIFMGDAGSAFLGFTFAALPVIAAAENPVKAGDFTVIAILVVWFFLFDSLFTLFVRLLKRRRIWRAHREHLYQRLVISGKSHATVTMLYGLLTMLIVTSLIIFGGLPGITPLLPILMTLILTIAFTYWAFRKILITYPE